MSAHNEMLTRRWFKEVWNEGRAEAIDEMLDAHCVTHGLGLGTGDLHGSEGFKSIHTQFLGAFPDMYVTVEAVIAAGDMVATRLSGEATHAGDHLGVAATNRQITFTGMTFARWQGGKIVEAWNNIDMLGLLKQVGAL